MSIHSPLPELDTPDLDFSSFVLERARSLPDRTALVDAETGATISYGQFTHTVDAAAGGLAARGLRPGDRAVLCGFNTPAYAIAAHAVWRAGGTVVTMNPLFTSREMLQELVDARPRYVIAAPEALERAGEAARQAGVAEVFALGTAAGVTPFASLATDNLPAPAVTVDPREDTALILYSSGTTGLPKGVLLTHRNLIASIYQLHAGDLARQEDVLIGLAPFFHVVGLHAVLNLGISAGCTIVTMARYDPRRFLQALQDFRVSSAFLTPPVVNDLARSPAVDEYDLSSLRSILCGAAPLGAEVERTCAERLGCVVRQGYGMTETSGPIATSPAQPERIRRGSVGELVPSTECRIVNPADGRELGPNEAGEVLVRGPQVMKGYLNQPAATAATIEPDGWLHTGDIGYADQDGFLYVVDRLKEIIKYKAYQVAPAELEAVLATHPAVAEAAVIPSPDAEAGEIPKAFVVLKAPASAEELLAYVASRVAPYKKVRSVAFVESIPKSPSGKILRRVLIEQERAAHAGSSKIT